LSATDPADGEPKPLNIVDGDVSFTVLLTTGPNLMKGFAFCIEPNEPAVTWPFGAPDVASADALVIGCAGEAMSLPEVVGVYPKRGREAGEVVGCLTVGEAPKLKGPGPEPGMMTTIRVGRQFDREVCAERDQGDMVDGKFCLGKLQLGKFGGVGGEVVMIEKFRATSVACHQQQSR
jgi:hypothetical protein